ncbi:DoxX family protein [Hymenobacter sp. DG01]|uniref:DoxX family protein n=1 Tax=Hymenobacter sp. DG01 TaxID=2584940 RepID=UPI00111CE9B1|nr:DoxX family protein [Hymenobacter sp. DG01]
MKKTTVFYWLSTGLLAALMLLSGVSNALMDTASVEAFRHLGYPAYLLPFLGVAKLLGVAALLVPGFPRLREWAYAGFVFDLSGAMYSLISVDEPAIVWLPIGVGFLLIAASYQLNRHRATASGAVPATPSLA